MLYNTLNQLLLILIFSSMVILAYFLLQQDSSKYHNKQVVTVRTIFVDRVLNPNETYAKFDRSLCQHAQPEKEYYVGTRACPRHVVTVKQGGRLCNQIWEYLSVWAVAKRTGYEPYVPTCIYNTVAAMYDSLTVGRLEEIAHCPLDERSFVVSRFAEWDKSSNLIFPMYSTESKLILSYLKDIPKEFVMRKNLIDESQRQLQILRVPTNTVYVGVHIRKTDYDEYLKRKFGKEPADTAFYERAMRVFEHKYKQVIFVIVSDDPDWCYNQFGKRKNVYVIGYGRKNSAELDLAILSSCNHTIFDYGSYGTWGAIMAGGETIYYSGLNRLPEGVGNILKWKSL